MSSQASQLPSDPAQDADSIYLPNMGRRQRDLFPTDVAYLFPDSDESRIISLFVTNVGTHTPKDNHWKLGWTAHDSAKYGFFVRRMEVVCEPGAQHLTNWGVLTKSCLREDVVIPVRVMDLVERKRLEAIAEGMKVRKPDGKWNCQDWVVGVLEAAEREGLLTRADWEGAVGKASVVGT